ncbi:phosphonate ABC transporter, permease protein PhnE [Dongia soli]|uniref:Phosphonate ABC transporter, permease protein PhnE n=1 Tax=Dongia soli TaxID=600628 RepID=A0ABU5EBB3_9PROT|nr:phosphonate ABC transporter, permease protein PhnE [Dongia soli]MDY0883436.1 phosphonate ABC transporter, permease protein PhnE [Dongia soli]
MMSQAREMGEISRQENNVAEKRRWPVYFIWGAVLVLHAWAWRGTEMNPVALIEYSGNMASFAAGFFPPDFHNLSRTLHEMLITCQIALWGTTLAVLTSAPLAFLTAGNVAPWWVVQPVRRCMDALRAINEMVFAMLFVVAVGLGPFAGVLALWLHTTGVCVKLFSEAVETADPRPVEAIRMAGGGFIARALHGLLPQVMPHWISLSLYRFESNVRSATVIGIVGAGGVGDLLWEYIRSFDYGRTAGVIAVIVLVVCAIDVLSQQLRRRIV